MAPGHRGDAHALDAFAQFQCLPGVQRTRGAEAALAQLARGVRRRQDRQRAWQLRLGDLVEMVAVVVRQQHRVDRRQALDRDRRLGQARARQAVAELRTLATVQEVRVGQQRDAAQAQHDGRGADELHRAAGRGVVGRAGGQRQHLGRLATHGGRAGQRRQAQRQPMAAGKGRRW
ncbi:MAG: hypothetical protein QM702_04805 [Rubrivivax sp.]